ncbi:peptidoglycan D,D-transpeptidase FtsI family protein [Hamadaea tsunoensis]|uniref:peptidoglycan D,D-transpeptidase FtsI family protein n=1 Tax=Hamadaea tsunoensis TaxID=53368 RepID=UPI00041B5FB2|nr:penicillin-binding protein 2 [Hamadaea tsunoensis]
MAGGRGEEPTGSQPSGRRRSGLGNARAYTPRGRTVRDNPDLRVVAEPEPPEPPVRKAARRRPVEPPAERKSTSDRGRVRAPRGPAIRVAPVRPPARRGNSQRRLRLATMLALLMFAAAGIRVVELQFEGAPAAAAAGLNERLQHQILYASRGSILDRNGAVMAHSIEARTVFADTTDVKDPQAAAAELSPLLGVPVSTLLPLVSPHNQPNSTNPQRYEVLARSVPIETGEAVQRLGLNGIGVDRTEKRDALSQDVGANLIGFTAADDESGLVGLEARFDTLLAGKNGERVYEVGRGEEYDKEIPGGYHKVTPARDGSSLELTIDRDLQYEVQRILKEKMLQVHATFGSATVLDAHSGELLAQASWPTYDARNPLDSKPADRGDVASNELVDPGSVHKAIVLAGALQEGVITPSTTVPVAPTIKVADKTYKDTHPFDPGTKLTLPAIMAFSSNVGVIKISQQLGADNLYKYQKLFGLGQPTGISIPGEASGDVRPASEWQGSDFGSIPIGNGVSVTPLQMTAAYAAIANNGVWVQPHLVRDIIGPDGKVQPAESPQSHQVISAQHAQELRTIMEAVTTVPHATGLSAAIPGYRVSGKTGTGAYFKNGGYQPGEVASFIGMAPADNPKYVIGVFAYTPGGNGGVVCGPAFQEMMSFTLKHFRVPPTGVKAPTFQLIGQ